MANDDNLADQNLPNPYPPLQHPPMMDLSFAALGWLNRAVQAVGSIRFDESVKRSRFYLERAARHARTPADFALITGMALVVQALIQADADTRELLAASLSTLDAALELGGFPPESEDGASDSESQDPAA